MNSALVACIQALVLFAVAPLISGVTRVARARMHNRRGPGVLQEYRDLIKLLGRQSVAPAASGWVFRLTPFVMCGVMLTIATTLPVVTVASPLPALGDVITLIYLFAIADSPTSHMGQNPWSLNLLLMAAGVVTTIPLLCFTGAATRLRLSTLGFFQYLAPSIQFFIGLTVFREPFDAQRLVGFGLIWCALLIYSMPALARLVRRSGRALA